jgi:hypothetical protein
MSHCGHWENKAEFPSRASKAKQQSLGVGCIWEQQVAMVVASYAEFTAQFPKFGSEKVTRLGPARILFIIFPRRARAAAPTL